MTDGQDHFTWVNLPLLTSRSLFAEAVLEVDALGTQPRSSPGRWCWEEERRGALDRLAALAGHDGHLLRRAAMHLTGPRHRNRRAATLLTEATRFAWRN
jgi:hypothetical protein